MSDLEAVLTNFAQHLGPSEESTTFGKAKVEKAIESIKRHSGQSLSFDRIVPVGGARLKTSCWADMDFDSAMFVNPDRIYPGWKEFGNGRDFEQNLESMNCRIGEHLELVMKRAGEEAGFALKKKRSWKLKWQQDGLSVDLVIGINASSSNQIERETKKTKLDEGEEYNGLVNSQIRGMIDVLQKEPLVQKRITASNHIMYSASVDERSIAIMKDHPQHHQIARLAKFWVKFCCPGGYVSGKSTLMSLIARTSDVKMNIEGRFKEFLTKLVDYKKIDINYALETKECKAPREIPRVVDPGNCYNNLLNLNDPQSGESLKEFMELCSRQAKKSLDVMERNSKSDWNWMKLCDLFLTGESRKNHEMEGKIRFSYSRPQEKCHFSKFIRKPSESDKRFGKKVKLFVCCVASFIPRYRTDKVAKDVPTDVHEFTTHFQRILVEKCQFVKAGSIGNGNPPKFSIGIPVLGSKDGFQIDVY